MKGQSQALRNGASGREKSAPLLEWAALLLAAMVIVAAAVRAPRLDLRPMHGDEAVNAEKFRGLWVNHSYKYDPSEYHGPTLHYITAASAWLQGGGRFADMDETTLRLACAAAGIGVVWVTWLVRGALGKWAAVAGAAFTALSPGMVFYSRYFIHEMLLVLFTFVALGTAWRWWRSGRIGWALVCGTALGLMFATKETSVLAFAAMGMAGAVAWWWGRAETRQREVASTGAVLSGPGSDAGHGSRRPWSHVAVGAAVGLVLAGAFYSSFGSNWHGLVDAVRTFVLWGTRGGNGGEQSIHTHPWYWYIKLFAWDSIVQTRQVAGMVVAALAAVGAVAIAVKRGSRGPGAWRGGDLAALRFLLVYTVVLTVLYAAIPYKTPWCMVSFLHPLLLLAGIGAVVVIRRLRSGMARWAGIAGVVALAGLLALLARESYAASFQFPADFNNPYAYAQPIMDIKRLPRELDRLARVAPLGYQTVIKVYASTADTWPLPWYLRRFDHVGCWTSPQSDTTSVPAGIILCSDKLWPEMERKLGMDEPGKPDAWGGGDYFGMRNDAAIVRAVSPEIWQRYVKAENAATQKAKRGGTR